MSSPSSSSQIIREEMSKMDVLTKSISDVNIAKHDVRCKGEARKPWTIHFPIYPKPKVGKDGGVYDYGSKSNPEVDAKVKTYTVNVWERTPQHTFTTRDGETISFEDYYKRKYDITLTGVNRPISFTRRSINVYGSPLTKVETERGRCEDDVIFFPVLDAKNMTRAEAATAWEMTPEHTFTTRDGEAASSADYYRRKHNLTRDDANRPTLFTGAKVSGSLLKHSRKAKL